jgi:hypothetical protein
VALLHGCRHPLVSRLKGLLAGCMLHVIPWASMLLTASATTRRTGATGEATNALLRDANARWACTCTMISQERGLYDNMLWPLLQKRTTRLAIVLRC